jgi:hypothetical protein
LCQKKPKLQQVKADQVFGVLLIRYRDVLYYENDYRWPEGVGGFNDAANVQDSEYDVPKNGWGHRFLDVPRVLCNDKKARPFKGGHLRGDGPHRIAKVRLEYE